MGKGTGKGTGKEWDPFISENQTAGIQEKIDELKERGGKISLPCGRYEIEKTILLNIPCIHIDGDSCNFERINVDGCAVGVWFAPRAAYYNQFRKFVFADNPYYGFYADGTNKNMHNLELLDNVFVRTGGAFSDDSAYYPAAVYFNNIHNSLIRDNLIDDPGTFWYFENADLSNAMHQTFHRDTVALAVRGNKNRIMNNVITNTTTTAIHIIGDGNVLLNNVVDNDVIIEGKGNQVSGLIFTNPEAKLIVNGNVVELPRAYV